MFEQESSQNQKKESQEISTHSEKSSSWLNKISHWFSSFSSGDKTKELAHKLKLIEKAKAEEKKVLLQQRNFYERLFSRSTEAKDKTILHTLESKEEMLHPLSKKVETPQAPTQSDTHISPPLPVENNQHKVIDEKKISSHLNISQKKSFFSGIFSRLFGRHTPAHTSKILEAPKPPVEVAKLAVPLAPVETQSQENDQKINKLSSSSMSEKSLDTLEQPQAEPSPILQPPPIISDLQKSKISVPSSQSVSAIDSSGVKSTSLLSSNKKLSSGGIFSRLFGGSLANKLAKEREGEVALQERKSVEQRLWQPSNGFNPNLIKNQEVVFFNWHENILVLCLALVMCCLAISLTYVGFLIWQKERQDASEIAFLNVKVIDDQIAISETEIKEVKEFNKKLALVSNLLDNHIYWTNFLTLLENTTLKDVYYERFSGDISGQYTIPAAASSLEAISLQLEVMKAYDKVKSVIPDTGQTSADGSQVQFNLGLIIDPLVFTK